MTTEPGGELRSPEHGLWSLENTLRNLLTQDGEKIGKYKGHSPHAKNYVGCQAHRPDMLTSSLDTIHFVANSLAANTTQMGTLASQLAPTGQVCGMVAVWWPGKE